MVPLERANHPLLGVLQRYCKFEVNTLPASFSRGRARPGGPTRNASSQRWPSSRNKYIPETRLHIFSVPSNDPTILDLSLRAQVQASLVNPFIYASATASEARPAMLIIIDGLDECSRSDVQRRILSEFSYNQINATQYPPKASHRKPL